MVSRTLMGVWAALNFLLLVAGAVTLALSIVWRGPNLLMNMVLSDADLTAGIILAIAFIITCITGIVGVIQRNHITIGLVITNYALLVDAIGIVIIGTFVWFFTLKERHNYSVLWDAATPDVRRALQDQLKCCGYFNNTDFAEISTFCKDQQFISSLNQTDLNNSCVTPITDFADMTLNNIFTTVYGYMAIVLCLLLATLCVIKKRHEDERFNKIDAKRGGKGFV
ncbi:hypothetical protein AGABI1DRAFT_111409 [Agaricus bisporus var. burnettii JB137-S8]|uniref:Tetraspanin n=2 Tax=Agaricus bisporus var. burnettii TaxID=192524 RepID=K5W7L6_AGABU|nr:hypothetical protein AGABI2DRAFT_190632 [Agaricus bisporus var. bisporus H97]XP_007326744.1 uncharacterized protein AGABI1DRAFT_111409 [Agaricus bisporus var. burnettii JB137-S8]EKM82844.1 hypothetical protein AGABI1DRAFT_111409 [Agaricus bisporus var. burnettii JB137-S8]EKV50242.1 hypothetical protein AGABI2DRAFT_190632 [Agaricus bisporus var. bisporus H97]